MINIFKSQRMQFFVKQLYKVIVYFLYRKNIIILVGDKGVFLSAFVRDKIIDKLFVPLKDKEDLEPYTLFFNKFKNFHIFFLLSSSECKIRHDLIPILQSIVKTNPIEKFIDEYFAKDDIVAHYVYNITRDTSEVWNTLFVSTPYKPPLSTLLEYVFSNRSLKFSGIYFLDLELKNIINRIIQNVQYNQYIDHLQIFVLILQSSGIKFIVKHQNNIIFSQTFEYPHDKSNSYIQGIIEQEVNERLIYYKNYITSLNLQVCIICVVEENLGFLLQQLHFGEHKVITISHEKTLLTETDTDSLHSKFSDTTIVKLFSQNKNFLASNNYLKSIAKLTLINSLIFKPFIAIIIILLFKVCTIKITTLQNYEEFTSLNEQYYNVKQEYYSIKEKYPYIQNATNLTDLYVLEALLQIPIPTPFDLLEKFLTTLDSRLHLDEINWQRLNLDNLLVTSNQYIKIEILLKFISNNLSIETAKKLLQEHIAQLHSIFNTMDINFIIFEDQIIDLPDKIIIPISIILTDQKG